MSIAFVQSPSGVLTAFQFPYAGHGKLQGTGCYGINASGTAVGSFVAPTTFLTLSTYGFTRSSDGITALIEQSGSSFIVPSAINDRGDAAGTFQDSNLAFPGFLQTSDGTFTTFDVPGTGANPNLIPNVTRMTAADEIIGYFSDPNIGFHGFIRAADGTVTQIDAPGATTQPRYGTLLVDINAAGSIVGTVFTSSAPHSFLLSADDTFTPIDPPNTGASGSSAASLNTAGVVVGNFADVNPSLTATSTTSMARSLSSTTPTPTTRTRLASTMPVSSSAPISMLRASATATSASNLTAIAPTQRIRISASDTLKSSSASLTAPLSAGTLLPRP